MATGTQDGRFAAAVGEALADVDLYERHCIDHYALSAFQSIRRAERELRDRVPTAVGTRILFERTKRRVLAAMEHVAANHCGRREPSGASAITAERVISAMQGAYTTLRLEQGAWLSGWRAERPASGVATNVRAGVERRLDISTSFVWRTWGEAFLTGPLLPGDDAAEARRARVKALISEVELNDADITARVKAQRASEPKKSKGTKRAMPRMKYGSGGR